MDWKEEHKRKKRTIEDVLKLVRDNSTVVVGMTPMEPQLFLSKLHLIASRVKNVSVFTCLNSRDYEFYLNKEYESSFDNNSWFFGPSNRKSVDNGLRMVTYVPNNLHQAGINLIDSREIDIFVGVASPMDKNGFFTLSASVVYEKDVLENAKTVVLEVNENAPRTHGDTQVHINEVDMIVEADYQLPEAALVEPSDIERRIGENIIELIEDGSTLQLGIGGIPNSVAKFLNNKKDLGIHTEMFTETMVDLFLEGVITNRKKSLWPGKFVCTFAYGTKRLYDFVDDNPCVFFLRGKYVNSPDVISQNEKMVSINTALMVDLTGNVCSEAIGFKHYSGTGGQLDTHRGAIESKGGKGIIALRSTAKNNTVSTIVPYLPLGSPVTIPRQDIDYVVTEFGVAHLRGKTIKERVRELINISHPDFRDWLESEAKKIGYI
jgi:acyl-CoA hydrolase